jgi:hypothetical protein
MIKADTLYRMIGEQRRWMQDEGETLEGYIERYGDPGMDKCHGDGGTAIYNADLNALQKLETQYREKYGDPYALDIKRN